jgi:hypothetical protein
MQEGHAVALDSDATAQLVGIRTLITRNATCTDTNTHICKHDG